MISKIIIFTDLDGTLLHSETFEFEKIRSQKESKQAEDDLKKDSSLNEMLEKFDGKIKKVSKI